MSTNLAWLMYLLVGIAYTIFVFWYSLTKDEARILSKQNVTPRSTIIVVHLLYLALIFSFMPFIPRIEGALPDWMTVHHGRMGSIFGVMLLLAALILRMIERHFIYAEVETES
jgi:amino acid transporter